MLLGLALLHDPQCRGALAPFFRWETDVCPKLFLSEIIRSVSVFLTYQKTQDSSRSHVRTRLEDPVWTCFLNQDNKKCESVTGSEVTSSCTHCTHVNVSHFQILAQRKLLEPHT